ncbi:PREDICTED: sodium/calcium exchanger 2 isoform X7 [Pseudopodoces humilis]|uniref:sodium/calcium exchanger 2 isoform X7 n=1 Tax=Pseudopodoces humilis TaxID=181119 RepID=UPI0006B6BEF0|nr:PREDICTED: sodium/calcium exchanger 2 isoform X7 [Pseudopodoces humilis]
MMYLFLGVSIIADRFMASIEVITSREKEITVTKANGETSVGTVRIWNETVSNLTLMALGSSAPEILLSLIEVCGHRFQAGELGPGTIVGSAAFNMFVVIAVCVYAIPAGESRRIKHLRVFFVTASWSIFAYIWLYLILAVITPGVVQVWEAFLTLLFFPACVVFAWAADKRLLFYKYVYKRYRADPRSGIIIGTEAERPPKDLEADGGFPALPEPEPGAASPSPTPEEKELDESRREVIQILKDLKQKHPEKELEQLMDAANYMALVHQQKSRAFYRIQATRLMTGAGNVLKKHAAEAARRSPAAPGEDDEDDEEDEACSRIFFEPCLYHCLENCGSVTLAVACQQGLGANQTFYVDFRTEDGSAKAGSDYEYSEGTLIFKPGETRKELAIGIIDDDIFEEDEHFFVRLLNLRVGDAEGMFEADSDDHPKGKLVAPLVATVTILDDDHAGIFGFRERSVRVSECQGHVEVTVVRSSGARGTVMVPFRTVEGTARGGGVDYEDASGELEFRNDETAKTLQVKIVDDEEYEKKENFFIELGTPRWLKRGDGERQLSAEEEEARRIADMGKPVLGDNRRLEVVIEESYDFKNTVDKLMKKTNLATVIGTHSWREQFLEAITVSAGDEDEDDEGREERLPSCFDYVMHFLTVFWKVLFACVPPTALLGGWAAFGVSILLLALLTALIGDLAAHFGCTLGLKDSVNAVVFVALGTSIPDTFASRVAALQDPCADASIGNVTGSNAVNVFLGLGLAWSVAAVYWAAQGRPFRVPPGTLAFPVTLFTIFAFLAIAVLLWRRRAPIGGELGGPRAPKVLTAGLFLLLWLLYVLFASLEAYCHIQGF